MNQPYFFGQNAQQLCQLLAIDFPLIQAPMAGGWTTPALAAAVANAGGLGMLAAARLSVAHLAAQIAALSELTTRPVGVNFLLAPPDPFDGDAGQVQAGLNQMRSDLGLTPQKGGVAPLPRSVLAEQLQLALDSHLPLISFAMGNPAPFVGPCHAAGKLVLGTATTVTEVVSLEQAGVDVIVVQGAEAGGHRATFHVGDPADLPLIGNMVLVPSAVDAVDVPIVASGGIMDGRGLAAALALGASAVQMGTRFLTTPESGAFEDYRRRLLHARETDSAITWHFTGRPARSLRNRFITLLDGAGIKPLPWPYQAVAADDIYRAAVHEDRSDFMPLLAGQGAGMARAEIDAAAVVRQTAADASRIISELFVPPGG